MEKKEKIAVAMSGGVDSSVSAYLLQKAGFEVFGIFMRLQESDSSDQSEAAARRVCQHLGIKFYPVNISDRFSSCVVEYFIKTYEKGLTPNPCVRCNRLIKFGELIRRAKELGADRLATGHYARLRTDEDGVIHLLRPLDSNKDQTYFLYHLTQDQLCQVVFPLGDMIKDEVRSIARDNGLPYLTKESQDICFLSGDHNDFLRANIDLKPGDIRTMDGNVVGRHNGLPLYTIGQRKGVEIGGIGPFYVAKCDYETNTLFVVKDLNDPTIFGDSLRLGNVSWVSGKKPVFPFRCSVNIRYRHKAVDCEITEIEDGCEVRFDQPQRAIAPGQSVTFYDGDEILGGGDIV